MAACHRQAQQLILNQKNLSEGKRTMSKFAKVAIMGAVSLLVGASFSLAQQAGPVSHPYWQPTTPTASPAPTHRAVAHIRRAIRHPAKPSVTAQIRNQSAFARMAPPAANSNEHRLILQVNTNDPAAMNLALNNAMNVTQYYKDLGQKVKIEVITFGPGLHMLREDTSPVKARIETMALSTPEVSFKACGNTQENMHKAENKDIPIIPQAEVVKSGVVRVMELEERGWTYVKP
jgi:uncharacterized protein